MSIPELENLVGIGKLKREPLGQPEFDALVRSGRERLADSRNDALALTSRFDLAYSAAHALSLAALRRAGYRSENRYLVFQVLQHTAGVATSVWRVLAKCHEVRNEAEYEGEGAIDERLVRDLIAAASAVDATLGPTGGA